MQEHDNKADKTDNRPLFPELDTGLYQIAFFINQYIQSLRQIDKRPVTTR